METLEILIEGRGSYCCCSLSWLAGMRGDQAFRFFVFIISYKKLVGLSSPGLVSSSKSSVPLTMVYTATVIITSTHNTEKMEECMVTSPC